MDSVVAATRADERLPSCGEMVFLFTDIVGSTQLWERDQDAMRRDLRRHDDLMRAAIEAQSGHVFKVMGDAFCAAFETVLDALRAALQAQRELAAERFASPGGVTVRMALHIGASDQRDGDYFGPTLNRVARLLAIGHGGQVLLSSAVAEAADKNTLPDGATLRDLGYHRLKDLTVPERVFQLVVSDLTADFPKLRSLTVLHNNLPQQTTSLVGRDCEVAEIKALVGTTRLVTLSGAGGVGKTRCALQVGADVLEAYRDGVWFVDLAPISDSQLVGNTIARIFELQETPNHEVLQMLIGHLKHKQLLLILDNCEHVVAEVSRLANAILRSCHDVRILATSREALNLNGETLYRMPSLAVPAPSKHLSAEAALSHGAVALFEERGRAANARFAVTDANAVVVADVCRRLDGIPLAIELAAARLRVLTANQLAQKLDERFRLLTGGDRTALPRQQTMRALIDWSYDLLSQREQLLFRALSIFAGSFTIDATIAICANETIAEEDVLDELASLVDKSLVLAEPSEDIMRYRMLESMRQYARERLVECGEFEAAATRHACAYADLAEQFEKDYETLSHHAWLAQTEPELENLRTALTWSFSSLGGEQLVGQRIAAALPRPFGILAAVEGRRWVKTALEHVNAETPPLIVAGLELADAALASVFNQFGAALTLAEQALAKFEELHEPCGVADAQQLAGCALVYLGRPAEGERLLRAALANKRARGSLRIGRTLRDLAVARALQGDVPGSRALFEEASATFEEADRSNRAITAATLAEIEFLSGNPEAALRLAEEALEAVRALGRQRTAASILANIAAYLLAMDHCESAGTRAREALELAHELQTDVTVAFALQHLAAVGALRPSDHVRATDQERRRAARLLGYVEASFTKLAVKREHTEQQEYDRMLTAFHTTIDDEQFDLLLAEGRNWSEDRAIAEALSL